MRNGYCERKNDDLDFLWAVLIQAGGGATRDGRAAGQSPASSAASGSAGKARRTLVVEHGVQVVGERDVEGRDGQASPVGVGRKEE